MTPSELIQVKASVHLEEANHNIHEATCLARLLLTVDEAMALDDMRDKLGQIHAKLRQSLKMTLENPKSQNAQNA